VTGADVTALRLARRFSRYSLGALDMPTT
jgi:hypothetical protein